VHRVDDIKRKYRGKKKFFFDSLFVVYNFLLLLHFQKTGIGIDSASPSCREIIFLKDK